MSSIIIYELINYTTQIYYYFSRPKNLFNCYQMKGDVSSTFYHMSLVHEQFFLLLFNVSQRGKKYRKIGEKSSQQLRHCHVCMAGAPSDRKKKICYVIFVDDNAFIMLQPFSFLNILLPYLFRWFIYFHYYYYYLCIIYVQRS